MRRQASPDLSSSWSTQLYAAQQVAKFGLPELRHLCLSCCCKVNRDIYLLAVGMCVLSYVCVGGVFNASRRSNVIQSRSNLEGRLFLINY